MSSSDSGLVEIAPGCAAYLQPDGSWGLSNAGVVGDGGSALLVDTLYDAGRTRALLDAAGSLGVVDVVVNTHANGDHCYGNGAVLERRPGVRIVSSRRARDEMREVPPSVMAWANRAMRLLRALPRAVTSAVPVGPASAHALASYWLRGFERFEFGGVRLVPPTEVFDDALTLTVGGVEARLFELGPAHTRGDVAVWLPDKRVLFTGDLLFHRGTPIVWAGPVSRFVAACDCLLALDAAVVVPGHGPVADNAAIAAQRDYLAFVEAEARPRLAAGASAFDTARDILGSRAFREAPWASWGEPERIAVNVEAVARELTGAPAMKPLALFAWMAALAR